MKRNSNKLVPFFTKSLKKSFLFTFQQPLSTLGVVKLAILGFFKPAMAAKAAFYRNEAVQGAIKQIPWMPMMLIVFGGVILLYKDLRFNLNLSAPTTMGGGSGIATNSFGNGVAQSVSNTGFITAFTKEQDAQNRAYINQYASIAIAEMKTFGIPASISLAQAISESQAGTSPSAIQNNNHFAMKCFSKQCKKGHCSNVEEMGHKAFFIQYESAWASWRAHSQFLTSNSFKALGKETTYTAWATGLERLGYHSIPNYGNRLIQLIEHYQLHQLDK